MKYLRLQQHRTCYLEAARTQVRLMKIRVKLQLNQYPGSILGTLVKLEDPLDPQPSGDPGQVQPSGNHATLGQGWRKRARRQRARLTGVVSTSSRYSVVSALPTRQDSAACCENFTSGGGTQGPPPCSGRSRQREYHRKSSSSSERKWRPALYAEHGPDLALTPWPVDVLSSGSMLKLRAMSCSSPSPAQNTPSSISLIEE